MARPSNSPYRILVINPNTTVAMTEGLKAPIEALNYSNTEYSYFTNPSPHGPASIDCVQDAVNSTSTILPSLKPIVEQYDAFLVACFSPHPLTGRLRQSIASTARPRRPVAGIFEAGIAAATNCTLEDERWVVITTAETWREPLTIAVAETLGWKDVNDDGGASWDYRLGGFQGRRFGGVETTGLTAAELHTTSKDVVDQRMGEAVNRVVEHWEMAEEASYVSSVVLGCAGMVGWEEKIRLEMRRRKSDRGIVEVAVIDPVKAGIGLLQTALRAGF